MQKKSQTQIKESSATLSWRRTGLATVAIMFDVLSLQDKGNDAQVPPTPTSVTTDAASQALLESQAREIESLKAMVLKLLATQPPTTARPPEAAVHQEKPATGAPPSATTISCESPAGIPKPASDTTPSPTTTSSASPTGIAKPDKGLPMVKQPKDEAEAVRNLKAMSQEELQERFDTTGEDL